MFAADTFNPMTTLENLIDRIKSLPESSLSETDRTAAITTLEPLRAPSFLQEQDSIWGIRSALPKIITEKGSELEASEAEKEVFTLWERISTNFGTHRIYCQQKTAFETAHAELQQALTPPEQEKLRLFFEPLREKLDFNLTVSPADGEVDDSIPVEKISRFGIKPVHTVWFGDPPGPESPHFGVDTLAPSTFAKLLDGDPDASVHFWCLPDPKYKKMFQAYFDGQGLKVSVHTPDEMVHDFPEVEEIRTQANILMGAVNEEHGAAISHLVELYILALHSKLGIFYGPCYQLPYQDLAPRISAAMTHIMRFTLAPDRRSTKDYVTLKDYFVYFLLATEGGYYFDSTVAPTSDRLELAAPMDFSPIVKIGQGFFNGSNTGLTSDIFALSCTMQNLSWQRRQMAQFILLKAIDFSITGQHQAIKLVTGKNGKHYYPKEQIQTLTRYMNFFSIVRFISETIDEPYSFQDPKDFLAGIPPEKLNSAHSYATIERDRVRAFHMSGIQFRKVFLGSHRSEGEQFNHELSGIIPEALTELCPAALEQLQARQEWLMHHQQQALGKISPCSILGGGGKGVEVATAVALTRS